MQLSFNGLKFLKEREGFSREAYQCSAGVWTIGYGTTKVNGQPVVAGQTCTEKEAEDYLLSDVAWGQTAVNKLVKVPLTQNMYDALVSFVYNIGETAFANSTLLKKLNSKNYEAVGAQFERWTQAGGKFVEGLLNRRKLERALFESK